MPKNIKVVIDTNWWVGFVIKKYQNKLINILLDENIEIYCSKELEEEVKKTLQVPRLAKYLDSSTLKDFTATFPKGLVMIEVTSSVHVCRDEKDDFLLALSKDAKADYLITGDKDLLVLKKFGKTVILTLTGFLETIND